MYTFICHGKNSKLQRLINFRNSGLTTLLNMSICSKYDHFGGIFQSQGVGYFFFKIQHYPWCHDIYFDSVHHFPSGRLLILTFVFIPSPYLCFCLRRQAPYIYKNSEGGPGAHPTPEWCPSRHVDLPIFSIFVSFFPFFFSPFFPFLFSLLSISFFGAPSVTPGGRPP